MLVDGGDASGCRVRRPAPGAALAGPDDLTAGGRDCTGQNFDQRRFAGAVGPDQAVYGGAGNFEARIFQCGSPVRIDFFDSSDRKDSIIMPRRHPQNWGGQVSTLSFLTVSHF